VSPGLRHLAWLLDSSIRIPGTNFRIGLDAIIGLAPGIGDVVGALISTYIIGAAWRIGTPKSTLMRMSFNVLVESVIGALPLLGDLFDAAWKSNERNVRLLESHLANPKGTTRRSRGFLLMLVGLCVLVAVGAVFALYGFIVAIRNLL